MLWLFGIDDQDLLGTSAKTLSTESSRELDLAARSILEAAGLVISETSDDFLQLVSERFGRSFPTTSVFSEFARGTLPSISARDDPDAALLALMDREEELFRALERQIVAERLSMGFFQDSIADVDGFVSFSLSIQNRRKSRVGFAFGHHVEAVLRAFRMAYTREAKTEGNSRPDFIFPSQTAYQNADFAKQHLAMLAVKTTCKDRWRQVLAEADRISRKHLLTLETSISEKQTAEMQSRQLQLVVPSGLHLTYTTQQQSWLLTMRQFIGELQAMDSADH